MDLKQLMQMDVLVTSVSKRPQKLHETASAIYVVTQEDIRRTGAVNLMEALRIVPGVLVSKINQNRFSVSVRGFNRGFGSDKLLVLIDGRSIYSPVSSGVNKGVRWAVQDVVLEDVERIEVIRGPGAALWGSNAVAGVINIITKSAGDTQGVLAAAGGGTEERAFGTLRYGGKLGQAFSYRLYGKYRDRDEGKLVDDTDSFDDKQMGQFGFRSDWQVNSRDHLTMQGDYYNVDTELEFPARFVSLTAGSPPFKGKQTNKGANFLTRWTRDLGNSSSFKFQAYYDRVETKTGLPFSSIGNQVDLDFQHNFLIGERQNFSWGWDYRFVEFRFGDSDIFKSPAVTSSHLAGFFVHDEITIIPKRWSVILGSKFEHNEYSGFEYQPNIRTVWTPNPNNTFWAAVSRAVRIPNALEEEGVADRFSLPTAPVLLFREQNDGRTDAEELLAFEAGYKLNLPSKKIKFDIAGFLYNYDNLIELVNEPIFFEPVPTPAHLVFPTVNENAMEGEIYGLELSSEWQVLDNWRLSGSYTFMMADFRSTVNQPLNGGVSGLRPDAAVEGEPDNIFNIRSYHNLPHDLELDAMFYYVTRNVGRNIPSYSRLDLRLGWKPTKNVEFSMVGQNLLDETHPELSEGIERDSETERSFYIKGTFRF
ncbi:MAG: TonB-dependent receptor [Nitrospinaceae bacterium]|nr:MAG: TonB-dependent receptor [Nitrospinaceae bacterium]